MHTRTQMNSNQCLILSMCCAPAHLTQPVHACRRFWFFFFWWVAALRFHTVPGCFGSILISPYPKSYSTHHPRIYFRFFSREFSRYMCVRSNTPMTYTHVMRTVHTNKGRPPGVTWWCLVFQQYDACDSDPKIRDEWMEFEKPFDFVGYKQSRSSGKKIYVIGKGVCVY